MRSSVYIVCPSVLSCSNLKTTPNISIQETTPNIFIQENITLQLTLNPAARIMFPYWSILPPSCRCHAVHLGSPYWYRLKWISALKFTKSLFRIVRKQQHRLIITPQYHTIVMILFTRVRQLYASDSHLLTRIRPSQQNVSFAIALPLVKVGRSVGQKKKEWIHEGFWVPVKTGLLSTKGLRGPFVRNQMVQQEQDYQMSKKATKTKYRLVLIRQDRVRVN